MDERLNQLLDNVAELYLKYGVKSVTMDDICHHLGISKKTLYEIIKEKDELVEQALLRFVENKLQFAMKYLTTD